MDCPAGETKMSKYSFSIVYPQDSMKKSLAFSYSKRLFIRGLYRVGSYFIVLGILLAELAVGIFVVVGFSFNIVMYGLLYCSAFSTAAGIILYTFGKWRDDE